jgi:hypothetical protein
MILKTLREGCLAGDEGAPISAAPSIMGEPKRAPGTEITGELIDSDNGLG